MFSGYGEAVDFIRGGTIIKGASPVSGNDYIAMVGEPDKIEGKGKFQLVPVGFEPKYPHFMAFVDERCPHCRMLRPKIERMIGVFDRMGLDVPVYEVDVAKKNVGNEILESAADVVGYPYLRYYSKHGLTAAYDEDGTIGGDVSIEEFFDGISKIMSLANQDADYRERLEKMIKANDKIIEATKRPKV